MNNKHRTYFNRMKKRYAVWVTLMIVFCSPNLQYNLAEANEERFRYLGLNYGYMNTSEWAKDYNSIIDFKTGHTIGGTGLYLAPIGDTEFVGGASLTYTYVKIPLSVYSGLSQSDLSTVNDYVENWSEYSSDSTFIFRNTSIGVLVGPRRRSPWVTFAGLEYNVSTSFIPDIKGMQFQQDALREADEIFLEGHSPQDTADWFTAAANSLKFESSGGFGAIAGIIYDGDLTIGVIGRTLFESTFFPGVQVWSLSGTWGLSF